MNKLKRAVNLYERCSLSEHVEVSFHTSYSISLSFHKCIYASGFGCSHRASDSLGLGWGLGKLPLKKLSEGFWCVPWLRHNFLYFYKSLSKAINHHIPKVQLLNSFSACHFLSVTIFQTGLERDFGMCKEGGLDSHSVMYSSCTGDAKAISQTL